MSPVVVGDVVVVDVEVALVVEFDDVVLAVDVDAEVVEVV